MSVRFRFVNAFDSNVRNRLPRLCQKYRTRCGRPPMNREPNTRFNVVAMVADSLKHGMTTDKQASVIRESLGSHVVPVRLRPWSAVIAALVAIGVGERVWVLRGRWGVVDSDEAVVGLMARA